MVSGDRCEGRRWRFDCGTDISNSVWLITFEGTAYCIITVEQTYYDWRQRALSILIFPIDSPACGKGAKNGSCTMMKIARIALALGLLTSVSAQV